MTENGKILYLDPSHVQTHSSVAVAPSEVNISNAEALCGLVDAIIETGMNPVAQLSGYLITEDPTYLPESTPARALAHRIGRDKLLETLLELYIENRLNGRDGKEHDIHVKGSDETDRSDSCRDEVNV